MNRLTERDEFGNADIIALSDIIPELYAELSFSETNALTAALNRLAAYEDTGLTPEQIVAMKAEYSDTFQAHLNQLCDIKDKQIAVLQALCEEMENTAKEYRAFKDFFDALYGRSLTVGNYHLNGALEPFDNFYDKAVDDMRKERHNADTV